MAEHHDYVALEWVKGEIEDTLKQAEQSLEAFVESPDDGTRMRFCLTYIHQVHGTLQMVEFYGAALLAEEMETVAQAIINGKVPHVKDAQEVLMQAILQLPGYLEHLQAGKDDIPVTLLPLLNDLRSARGDSLLTETSLFSPNLLPLRSDEHFTFHAPGAFEKIPRLREAYRLGLIGVIRNVDLDKSFSTLAKVCMHLEQLCGEAPIARLWWIAGAVVEGMSSNTIDSGLAVKTLLRQVEKEIGRLQTDGETALNEPVPEELAKNLLYYIAKSSSDASSVRSIKQVFGLISALPTEQESAKALQGSYKSAMDSVVSALTEELVNLKERFDLFTRSDNYDFDKLAELGSTFKQISDTLAVLGLGPERKSLLDQNDKIESWIETKQKPEQQELMAIASELLMVEVGLNAAANKTSSGGASTSTSDIPVDALNTAQAAVVKECRNGLEQVKDSIISFIASQWETSEVEAVPELLKSVEGALFMVPQLARAAEILAQTRDVVETRILAPGSENPSWEMMDGLADAVAGVDYYLERVTESAQEEGGSVLDVAAESISAITGQQIVTQELMADHSADISTEHEDDSDELSLELMPEPDSEFTVDLADEETSEFTDTVSLEPDPMTSVELDSTPETAQEPEPEVPELSIDLDLADGSVEADALPDLDFELPDESDQTSSEDDLGYSIGGFDSSDIQHAVSDAIDHADDELELDFTLDEETQVASETEVDSTDEEPLISPIELPEETEIKLGDELSASEGSRVEDSFVSESSAEDAETESDDVALDVGLATDDVLSELILEENTPQITTDAPVEPEEPEASGNDMIDEEIIEIFTEEAEEVQETIAEFLPAYKADYTNTEAQTEVRRAFHTLKGSGRLVGAEDVGELAWKVENLLNRVIDQTIEASPVMFDLIDRVCEVLPSLVDDFSKHQKSGADVTPLMNAADEVLEGKTPAILSASADKPKDAPELIVEAEEASGVSEDASGQNDSEPSLDVEHRADEEHDADEEITIELDEASDLLNIFKSEAETHLAVIYEFYTDNQNVDQVSLNDDVQRALHTLKGSAHMAGVTAVADLASECERIVKEARSAHLMADSILLGQLNDAAEWIAAAIKDMSKETKVSFDMDDEWLTTLSETLSRLPSEVRHTENSEKASQVDASPDHQMMNIFLMEGMDILGDIELLSGQWRKDALNTQLSGDLEGEYITLARAAKMSRVDHFSDVSEALSKLIGEVSSLAGEPNAAFFDELEKGYEYLVSLMDLLAAGQSIPSNDALIGAIHGLDRDAMVASLSPEAEAPLTDDFGGEVSLEGDFEFDEADDLNSLGELEEPTGFAPPTDTAEQDDLASDDDLAALVDEFDEFGESVDAYAEPEVLPETSDMTDEDESELVSIFLEEADDIVSHLDENLQGWQRQPDSLTPVHELQRSIHTLKGGARLAEFEAVGDLCHELENLYEGLSEGRFQYSQPLADLLQDCHDAIASQIGDIHDHKTPGSFPELEQRILGYMKGGAEAEVVAETEEFSELSSVADRELSQAAPVPLSSNVDPELVEIFLEEAEEILESITEQLESWADNQQDLTPVAELQRELHTLKGGARMAELAPIGDLGHELENLYEGLVQGVFKSSEPLLELLRSCHDRLADMIDAVNSGVMPTAAGDLVQAVTSYCKTGSYDLSPADTEDGALAESDLEESAVEDAAEAGFEESVEPDVVDDSILEEETELSAGFDDVESLDVPTLDESYGLSTDAAEEDIASETDSEIIELTAQDGVEEFDLAVTPDVSEDSSFTSEDSKPQITASELEEDTVVEAGVDLPAVDDTGDVALDDIPELSLDDVEVTETHSETDALDIPVLTDEQPVTEPEVELPADLSVSPDLTDIPLSGIQELTDTPDLSDTPELADIPELSETLEVDDSLDAEAPEAPTFEEVASEEVSADETGFDETLPVAEDDFELPALEDEIDLAALGLSEEDLSGDLDIDLSDLGLSALDAAELEISGMFHEEAKELFESLDNVAHSWRTDPANQKLKSEVLRLLHTIKGGARVAKMDELAGSTHDLESYVERASDTLDEEYFSGLEKRIDVLQSKISGLSLSSQAPAVAEDDAELSLPTIAADDALSAGSAELQIEEVKPLDAELNVVDEDKLLDELSHLDEMEDAPEELILGNEVEIELIPAPEFGPVVREGIADQTKVGSGQEQVKVSSELLENLVNLAGETSISRGRLETEVSDIGFTLEDMDITVGRLQEQLKRLDLETQAQISYRTEMQQSHDYDDFDPLEMDRYTNMQQLSRSLLESVTDILDLRATLENKVRDSETLLLQQSRINTELQEGLMRTRMVPFSRLVPRLRRIVRQVSQELGKQVDFKVHNAEGEMDRTVLERMVAPLEHMLRNAVDHGIEMPDVRKKAGKKPKGTVDLFVGREGGEVVLKLKDDGAGVNFEAVRNKAIERQLMKPESDLTDHEVIQFIFSPGFSTAKKVTQISGRGVGMDVVNSEIKQLGGNVAIDSVYGKGSEFDVRLPFTVSVNRALMVKIGDDLYAIPLNTIEGIVRVSPYELEEFYREGSTLPYVYAGKEYRMEYMGDLLKSGHTPKLQGQVLPLPVLLVRGAEHPIALQVDSLMGSREVVVKSLGAQFSTVEGVSGATILGDGSVVIILDLAALIRSEHAHLEELANNAALAEPPEVVDEERPLRVMVVDDSVTVRKVTSRVLQRQGYDVSTAKDGVDAIAKLQDERPDIMLLDIEMPRMDGFEVASFVRHNEQLADLPIIMITSRTGEKHRERAMSIGVNHYMGKPFQETTLLETIELLVGKQ